MSGGGEVQQARTDLLARRFLPRMLRVRWLVPCHARITATAAIVHVRVCVSQLVSQSLCRVTTLVMMMASSSLRGGS